MNPKRLSFIRRHCHDGIRDAQRMIDAERRNPSPGVRHEIVVQSQELKIKTLEILLWQLRDNVEL